MLMLPNVAEPRQFWENILMIAVDNRESVSRDTEVAEGVGPGPVLSEASYKPFPSFEEWLGQPVTAAAFDVVKPIVDELNSMPVELRRRALDNVRQVATLETGAIEDLYP